MSTPQTDFYDKMASSKWLKSANKWYNQPIIEEEEEEAMRSIEHLNELTKDQINPTHYKGVAAGKQYIELMKDLLEGYSGVEAHLLGQIYKYSMRLGKKDSKEQDATKISWYAQCLANYYRTGKVETGWK